MGRYLLGRLVQAVASAFGVLAIVFVVMRLSGDPTILLVPEGTPRELIEELRRQLGFDRPILVQFGSYLADLARFDLGTSVVQRIPVVDIVAARIPYTIALAAGAFLVAFAVGIPAGVLMALYRGTVIERALSALVVTGQSMPTFWSGILMILLFSIILGWLPASGADGPASLIMPSIALGALSMATFARMARISVVDELSKDYVRAARARGLPLGRVVTRHVLRNASVPVITIMALEIGNLLAGAIIVETVFAWPGIGQLAIQAIESRDFLVVQTIVLFVSFTYIAVNLLADLAYAAVDPRIKLQRA
jgi:peptide/nickel transport system permease protein